MNPVFFTSAGEFRRWLRTHHATATELWVGYHKKGTGQPSLTWAESVDQALCFGWIDGIRKSVDQTRYMIRFTPRRPGSTWSRINVARVAELTRAGKMAAAGRRAFEARDPQKVEQYSFEQRDAPKLDAEAAARFRAHRKAWAFFTAQPPGYRRLALWWVVSAKQAATRARRLDRLIADSAAGQRIGPLRRKSE